MKKVNTPCKNCIFAVYQKNTQIGCKLKKIDLFKKYNINVIEAYDYEKEFYVIEDKHCLWYRTDNWIYVNKLLEEQQKQLKEELELQYHVIIFTDNDFTGFLQTLNSILNQTLLPKHITVITKINEDLSPVWITEQLQNTGISYRIQKIIDLNLSLGNMYDLAIDIINYPYYFVCHSKYTLPTDTFQQINNKIINELYPISILLPNNNGNGLFVLRRLHMLLNGNACENFISKVKKQTENLNYFETFI